MTVPVLTTTQTRNPGIHNRVVLRVSTDSGTATTQAFTPGFVPRYVRIVNLTDRIQDEWFEGMADDSALHTVANGTVTLATSNGVTVGTRLAGTEGTVTFAAAVMIASKVYAIVIED